ncbi:MAG: hypothetical protein R3D78_08710 [Paracoccaceae bacterium]|jgi:hypothetical protein
MMRVFLHAGCHKTGTTSAQGFLFHNRERIWPHAALILPQRAQPVTRAVHACLDDPGPDGRVAITRAMADLLAGMDLHPKRRILVSAENLLGRMPLGLPPEPYPDAAPILRALVAAFEGLGWPVEVTIYLSTRPQKAWAESVWAHQLRKDHLFPLTDDLPEFAARLGRVPLAEQVARIAAALPDLALHHHDLADLAEAPFGPGQPFLEFLNLPAEKRAAFTPVPPGQIAPPRAISAKLLELNRSGLDRRALAAAKRALLDGPPPATDRSPA